MFEIIYILWLRQIKRHFRSKSRLVGSLGQPLLFLIALGFGLGPMFQQAGAGNYLDFIVPGIIAMGILFTSIFNGFELIWDKQFGFMKETFVAPVPRYQILLGKTLGGATVATIQGILILILTLIVGFTIPDLSVLPLALIFMFLIAIFYTLVGITIASLLEDLQGFQLIMNFLVMPTFFLSGAIFPLENLNGILKLLVSVNPLSYGIDGMRSVLINQPSIFGLSFDLILLFSLSIVILGVGTYLFNKIQIN